MSLIKSFNNLLNNNNSTIIAHTRNASTSPKRIPLKDQIIQQISTIMSLELNKIDTRDIETKLSIYFNLNENDDASSYIKSLCAQISDIKNSTICKVKNFLNHNINSLIKNSIDNNNNFNDNNLNNNGDIDSMRNKFKTILKEVKVLNNNSRVKFKKLYDTLSNEYDKILSTMYDYIQKNNTKLIIDRLNRIEQIKNDILFDVTSVENIQNKFSDTIKNIINKDYLKQKETITKNDFNKTTYNFGRRVTGKNNFRKKNNNNNNNFDNSLNLLNINSYLSQSENDIYNKTFSNGFDISNYNNNYNNSNNDEIEIIKLYRKKIKEKKNEIEKLKQLLQQEKESKNKAINDLNKLQYSNKMSSTLKNSQKNFSNLEKFNKLTEMIIGFTYSMNNLRNSLYQKTISHMDAKNIYGKLKMKLISLIEEAYTLKKNLTNNNNNNKNNNFINDTENNDYDEDLNIDENNNNNDNDNDNDNNNNNDEHDIKTIKEENENSQILSERASGNIIFNNNNNNQNNKNGNVVNNNITLTALPNYNIEALIEENKNLRKQLEEKILNYSENINNNKDNNKDNNDSTDNKENNNNEIGNNNLEIYQKQISELKKIILQKDQELEEIRNISMKSQKEELNNLIQNNTKNLEQLKSIYQLLIDGKDNRIKELEEEIISYEKEIELLKEENNKLKNECRKDKILSEAEVNNLKNQKIELQCLLEQGGGSSKTLLNMTNISSIDIADKEKIIKLENEIKIKNKQIIQLTQNHENDLKELNLAIEMLKLKISQLEEENTCLSSRKKENDKNE